MNCPLCDHDIAWRAPCTVEAILLPIHARPRTRYRRLTWTGRRPCPGCGTSSGHSHHLCCERERCPACAGDQPLTTCHEHFLWAALPRPPEAPDSHTP
jgi:hypothetical protein